MDPNTERREQRERLVKQLEKLTTAQQWLSESSKKGDEVTDDYGQLVDSFVSSDTGDADDVGAEDDKARAFL